MPCCGYIIDKNLSFDFKQIHISKDVIVTLRHQSSSETVNICLHSNQEYALEFDKTYFGFYHLFYDDELIEDFKYKKMAKYSINNDTIDKLKKLSFSSDDINIIKKIKDQIFYHF